MYVGVIAYKEMLYVIGGVSIEESGTTVKTVLNCVQRYDPLEDWWVATREHHVAVSLFVRVGFVEIYKFVIFFI